MARILIVDDSPTVHALLTKLLTTHGHECSSASDGEKGFDPAQPDAVYALGPDGTWKLHGRIKPNILEDPKTRTPPKKP